MTPQLDNKLSVKKDGLTESTIKYSKNLINPQLAVRSLSSRNLRQNTSRRNSVI